MDLVVFGANGPTGRQVVRQALAAGHHVAAVTRKPDEFPVAHSELTVVTADVTDAAAVARAVAGQRAVISTYGVPYSRKPITVYSQGMENITRAMADRGVARLVCVSSTTVATGEAPGESVYWRKVVIPLLRNVIGRTLYDDMQRMEEIVAATDLDWTIMQPAGLFDAAEPTTDYEVAPHRLRGRFTSRADLALALVAEATEPRHSRSIVEIITRSELPSPLATVLKEAFGVDPARLTRRASSSS